MLTKTIKIFSGSIFLICLFLLAAYMFLGLDTIGEYLNFDPSNISLTETNLERTVTYTFSLADRIYYLLAAILLLMAVFATTFIKASAFSDRIKSGWAFFKQYSVQCFYQIKASNVKYILIIPLAAYIYYACTAPITHDEAITYVIFVRCSLLNTIVGYTLPNNHVLFSVIEHIFIKIPFVDLLFKFRLFPILTSFFTWIIAYRFVRKYANENAAITFVAIASTVYMILQYSFFARGYSLLVLFCVVCMYAACNIIHDGNRLRDWTIFSMCGALGFYTMPSFLYPFFTINVFILCFNYRDITKQIRFNAYTLGGVFILYLPVLIVLGWEALSGNQFVRPLDRQYVISQLIPFSAMTLRQVFAIPPYLLAPAFIAITAYSLIMKEKKIFVLWLICLITPFVILTAHSVLPFYRTFIYYGFIFVLLSALSLKNIIGKIPLKFLLTGLIAIQIFQVYRFEHKLDHLMNYYAECDKIIAPVLEDNKSYFTNALFLNPNLRFEIARHNYNSSVTSHISEAVSADSLERYDVVILESTLDETSSRKPAYTIKDFKNTPINIYK